ncbi:AMP binding protein [Cristinia sonorae]|uniref:AMP binding protein n=1 Tax=Cristinia sonorae TaxID=1940300 RepID=A0A8K0UHE3_9AGAR|nr:AMP binding protein [Cristinia sonorae]
MAKIYKSHLPSLQVPDESIFTHLFSTRFFDFPPSSPAFIDAATDVKLTRGDVRDMCLALAFGLRNTLKTLGGVQLKRGDVVLIFSPNSILWPIMLFGSIAAGLRVTLANSNYVSRELEHQWVDSRAKAIFVAPPLLPVVQDMFRAAGLSEAETRQRIVLADWGSYEGSGGLSSQFITMTKLLGGGKLATEEKFPGKQSSETVLLCYSSGTTGKPKGVETTHRNITYCVNMTRVVYPTSTTQDVMLAVLPFFHIFGVSNILTFSFLIGSTIVIMPKFDPVDFCRNIEKYKVTMSMIVPPICLALIHHPATTKFNLKSLRFMASGAAPLSEAVVKATEARLQSVGAQTMVCQGYGLTETSPTTHFLPLEDRLRKVGSVGVLIPNLEARLVVDNTTDAELGGMGELWVRGPNVMKGYLNNPEATKNSITLDGWFKTGDVAIRDSDGYYYIVDRQKELIKYKGFQVAPAELESVLIQHPDIVDAAVIGVYSDKDASELPRAYVVHGKGLKGEAAVAFGNEVEKWIAPRVAKHKLLRGGVVVVDAVPRSAAGKILRRELRDLAKREVAGVRAKL